MSESWTVIESAFDRTTAKAWEGLFTLGSGYLHIRGSLEEHLSDAPQNRSYDRRPTNVTSEEFPDRKSKWGTYVPGVYGPHPTLNNELINLPWLLELTPIVAGERLDVETAHISTYQRTLRLADATLTRTLRWHTTNGQTVDACFERFVSLARPHLVLQRLTLAADRPAEATILAGIDADVRTNGHDHFRGVVLRPLGPEGLACFVQTDGGDAVEIVTRLRGLAGTWRVQQTPRTARLAGDTTLSPNQQLVIEKRSAVATSRDLFVRPASQWLAEADGLSFEQLHAEHAAAWHDRWKSCDVEIDGNDDSQRALRVALYHLLRSHVTGDPRVAIDAKGYSGEAYWGRFFWDTEMFLLPFYLYTDPARARTLAEFRIRTLDGARRNATRYRYPGARYAWESDTAGNECCPNWQYADHEVHVTADVAYGLAHYARATNTPLESRPPDAFSEGSSQRPALGHDIAEVLVETARYWLARLDHRAGDDHPSLLGVMGPDEYTPIASNNAYTNRLARFALELAAKIGRSGGASAEECAAFAEAARGLPILRADDGVLVLQCEEFMRLAEPQFETLWRDRARPFASQVPQERLYRSKCLKQADVLMLMMLFPGEFSDAEVRRAWDTYLPLTTHDSSLSAGVHALIACRLGLHDDAWRFWQRTLAIDTDPANGGAAEGVHIAAAAMLWQIAIFGFAGMRTAMQTDVLTLDPRLPRAWRRLAFPIRWRGVAAFVTITSREATVENRGSVPLAVQVGGDRRTVAAGAAERWSLRHQTNNAVHCD